MPIQSTKNIESCLVLIVDDDHISSTLVANILTDVCRCFTASSAADAIEFCEHQLIRTEQGKEVALLYCQFNTF